MHANFEINGMIYLVVGSVEYDLHNNFDFVGFEYRPTDKIAWLRWRRAKGEWVPQGTPACLNVCFTGVRNLAVRQRDDEMPFSEDSCLASITFLPAELDRDFEAICPEFRRSDEHLSLVFQSGAAMKIWAESATYEIQTT